MNNPQESSAIRMLKHEHHFILKVVHALAVVERRVRAGEAVDTGVMREAVRFLREFADACHHAKEEELLFPLVERKFLAAQICPIAELREEHARGRKLVGALDRALTDFEAGRTGARIRFLRSVQGIVELYPAHIGKEDRLVFPCAGEPEQATLEDDFALVEERMKEAHAHFTTFAGCMERTFQF